MVLSGLWALRYRAALHSTDVIPKESMVKIQGYVTSQPYLKASYQIMRLERFQVLTEPFPRFSYGDHIQLIGNLQERMTDSGQTELWLIYPEILTLQETKGVASPLAIRIIASIYAVRQRIQEIFSDLLPEPHASLTAGVVLGVHRSLAQDFERALRQTGTIHVIVASGYNVSVVAGLLMTMLGQFLNRRWVIPLAILGILLYTIMAGGEPPIIRAAIMGSLAFIAQFLGKQYHGLWVLSLTGLLMALISPLLIFDVGFQLSVAATFGILALTPTLTPLLARGARLLGRNLTEDLAVTLGAQLSVLPILLVHFGSVSWISPLVNLIVGNLVPVIMGFGGLLAGVGFLWLGLARVVALLVWVPLEAFVEVVNWFDSLALHPIRVSTHTAWWVAAYYALMFFWIWKNNRHPARAVIQAKRRDKK